MKRSCLAMKKILAIFLSTCCFVLCSNLSTCSANISLNRIALGGLHVGDSVDDLIRLHGTPSGDAKTYYYYGECGAQIYVHNKCIKKILAQDMRWITPDGVRPGMYADALNSAYGKADQTWTSNGFTYYKYEATKNRKHSLTFMVSPASGMIRIISISGN